MKTSNYRNINKTLFSCAIVCGFFLLANPGRAGDLKNDQDQNIRFDAERKVFLLQTNNTSYAFGLGSNGQFINLHWGGRIENTGDLPEPWQTHYYYMPHTFTHMRYGRVEYPVQTAGYIPEPCLRIEQPENLVNLRLSFDSHEISGNHLQVVLKAANYPFYVNLHYQVYPEVDLIDRWVEVSNKGKEKIVIGSIQSAAWYVPHSRKYRLTHIGGNWGKEWLVRREFLEQGEKVLGSRNGISGHQHIPFFALDQDGVATEKSGEVWFGTLQWSGSWKMIVEQDLNNQVRVAGGTNDYNFALELNPGENRTTPVFTAGYTTGGFGEATRLVNRYQQKQLYHHNTVTNEVPVIFNTFGSLEGTYGGRVTEENVMDLIPRAAEIGVEMFIIDAGWQTATGEWTVNKTRFPRGLKPVIDEVRKHGMKFGLWMEPENVRSDAKIFNEKEEWFFAKNPSSAMLNLSRDDVYEYLYQEISRVIRENELDYFKIDFNRYFDIPDVPDRLTMPTKYTENFYRLFERLRKEFPGVLFENCASGSGRPDVKMDTWFGRINRSDIQEPLNCLEQHEGFTYLHPSFMAGGGAHINRYGDVPFKFMSYVGMMGWLSIGLPLAKATQEELDEIKGYISLFKKYRHITRFGEVHRIASFREYPYAMYEFVLPDASEALLFAFAHGNRFNERIPDVRLESLAKDKVYDIEVYGSRGPSTHSWYSQPPTYKPVTGNALMENGLLVELLGDYDCRIFHLKARN
jgi:alpha-galactosidase